MSILISIEKTSLLFGWLRNFFRLVEESIRGIVVTNIPKVLPHWNNEGSNNQNGKDGNILA